MTGRMSGSGAEKQKWGGGGVVYKQATPTGF